MNWVQEHKQFLLEQIQHNKEKLEELRQKNISNWDDLNKDNYNRTMQNLEYNIEWHSETVRLIDETMD